MPNLRQLPQELFDLLKEVVERRCSELAAKVTSRTLPVLTIDDLQRIEEEVALEMMATGIEDGDLNDRGLLLDDLIGEIVMIRIEREDTLDS